MTNRKKILIVDDDKIYHFILKNIFSKVDQTIEGYFSENGQDAIDFLKLAIANNNLPDIILLDINMPIMNGWQFLEEFNSIKSQLTDNIPIYLISSSNNTEDIENAKLYQIDKSHYILKPLKISDIENIL